METGIIWGSHRLLRRPKGLASRRPLGHIKRRSLLTTIAARRSSVASRRRRRSEASPLRGNPQDRVVALL
ncbi:MAG TPA: hypothetical protein V6C71_19625 [Coleofasciculaceae cyanobacterium]